MIANPLRVLAGCCRLLIPALTLGQAVAAPTGFLVQAEAEILPEIPSRRELPADFAGARALLITQGRSWTDEEKTRLARFLEQGGGVVLVHDAIVASGLVGGDAKRWSGPLPLFFTPPGRSHPVTGGISNLDLEDEMIHGLDVPDGSDVLATTWAPNRKHLKGTVPQPYVYGVSPMVWTRPVGAGRLVCFVPGKNAETLRHPAVRVMLGRALAWAGRADDADAFTTASDRARLTYPPGGPLSPEESLASLVTHPQFEPALVAAEPLISKPMNLNWDRKGRLWVVESVEYPEGRDGGGPEAMYAVWQRDSNLPKPPPAGRAGGDRISWLEDTDGDGRMDRKHVFADDLDLATSFCFFRDGVIVAQPPEILLLRDADGDGRADDRRTLYRGLGTADRHAVLNNLRWGVDGWIYATHGYAGSPRVTSGDGRRDFGAIGSGIVRFRPDGTAIEMVSAKSGNCWGVEITADGGMFFTQPTSGDLVMHVPVSDRLMAEGGMGSEPSWQVLVHLRPVKPLMTWEEIVENQPNDVIGSFTAACGCAIYEGGAWPEAWRSAYFTAEPTVHIVHHEQLTPVGVTFTAAKTREEEFSATRDFWSRPIDTRIGPDGQLYVIDFYNQAILHNDPRGPIHLWNNQAARPDRDHFFGRIFRYRHRDSRDLPAAPMTTPAEQVAALSHPNREVRLIAQRAIEEGELATAAKLLESATGVARLHALWVRAAAGALRTPEILAALADPDAGLRVTAARVMAAHPALATPDLVAKLAEILPAETDPGVRLQLLAALPAGTVLPAGVLVELQADCADRWTQAAIARVAKSAPAEVLAAALAAPQPDRQAPLAALLFDAAAGDPDKLAPMVRALAGSRSPAIPLSSLASLRKRDLPRAAELDRAFAELAGSDRPELAAAALPLAARAWDADDLASRLPGAIGKILQTAPDDAAVLAALATLPAFPEPLPAALRAAVMRGGGPVLDALRENPSADATQLMISLLPSVAAAEKAGLLEALLGRPASARALVDALDEDRLAFAVVGAQGLSRLADHPDAEVKRHAAPVIERFRGAAEAKDAVIARLLPEVTAPGDPEVGHQLYGACGICHQFRGEGTGVGPVLEGIGVHGVEALLTHIVDPNREVEPSYHVWNVTTTDGRSLAGYISRETAGSLFLRNAGGEVEVPRDSIAAKVDTGKSLMPEGFEGLGGAGLRDLIAYLRSGEERFHTLSFGKAATADGSRGVYLDRSSETDRVGLKRYGLIEERGVPFELKDPAIAAGGKNVIVLKGGMEARAVSQTMPRQVEIPAGVAAGRVHLLGAVAGWGFPAHAAREPLLTLTVEYEDGTSEDIVLQNGVDIADHFNRVDVPGSAATELTSHGQIRYLWRDLAKPAVPVRRLVLTSADSPAAPMVAAITLESPAKDGTMAPPPAEGGPAR